MNQHDPRQILNEFVKHELPADLDLWPAVRAQLEAHARQPERGALWPRLFPRSGRSHASVGSLLVLCIVLPALAWIAVATVPRAEAMVRHALQRFGMVLMPWPEAERPVPSSAVQTGVAERIRPISLAEAQRQVPFHIPLLTWRPNGLQLQGAMIGRAPSTGRTNDRAHAQAPLQVMIFYRPRPESPQGVFLQVTQGNVSGGYAFPASAARAVTINGRPATYVHGAWQQTHAGDAKDLRWDETADYGNLSWAAGGFTYMLSYSQLGLNVEEMIRIAESLR